MSENEKPLMQVFYEAFERICTVTENAYPETRERAFEAVAAEGVRRWLASLPPGDEGLAAVVAEVWRAQKNDWNREGLMPAVVAAVAAVLAADRAMVDAKNGERVMSDAISQRLRIYRVSAPPEFPVHPSICDEAADRIETLDNELAWHRDQFRILSDWYFQLQRKWDALQPLMKAVGKFSEHMKEEP